MTSVRSRLSTRRLSADKMLVEISRLRRGFYAVVSLVLLFGMFSRGLAPLLEAGLHPGTVFYAMVVAIALGAAGWNVRMVFDRYKGTVSRVRGLFGFTVSRKEYTFPSLEGLLLRRIILFGGFGKNSGAQRPNIGAIGRGGITARRRELGRLYLVSKDQKPELIEESSDQSELWTIAETISEFTGLTIRSEEI